MKKKIFQKTVALFVMVAFTLVEVPYRNYIAYAAADMAPSQRDDGTFIAQKQFDPNAKFDEESEVEFPVAGDPFEMMSSLPEKEGDEDVVAAWEERTKKEAERDKSEAIEIGSEDYESFMDDVEGSDLDETSDEDEDVLESDVLDGFVEVVDEKGNTTFITEEAYENLQSQGSNKFVAVSEQEEQEGFWASFKKKVENKFGSKKKEYVSIEEANMPERLRDTETLHKNYGKIALAEAKDLVTKDYATAAVLDIPRNVNLENPTREDVVALHRLGDEIASMWQMPVESVISVRMGEAAFLSSGEEGLVSIQHTSREFFRDPRVVPTVSNQLDIHNHTAASGQAGGMPSEDDFALNNGMPEYVVTQENGIVKFWRDQETDERHVETDVEPFEAAVHVVRVVQESGEIAGNPMKVRQTLNQLVKEQDDVARIREKELSEEVLVETSDLETLKAYAAVSYPRENEVITKQPIYASWTLSSSKTAAVYLREKGSGQYLIQKHMGPTGSGNWASLKFPSLPAGKKYELIIVHDGSRVTRNFSVGQAVKPVVSSVALNGNALTVKWSPSYGASKYEVVVERRFNGSNSWVGSHNYRYATSTTATMNLDQKNAAQFRVKVIPRDANNRQVGQVSDYRYFSPSNSSLPAPTVVTPKHNGKVHEAWPSYGWNRVDGAKNYHVQIVERGTNRMVYGGYVGNINSFRPTNSNNVLHLGKTYDFKIRAQGTNNQLGAERVVTFSYQKNTQTGASAPVVTYPTNNGTVTSTKPTYKWNRVNGATNYYVQVIDKSTNRTIVNQYAGNTTAFTPNVTLGNGKNYEFRIKALVSGRFGEERRVNFKVQVQSTAPVVTYPTNNGTVTSTKPTYKWNRVNGATNYYVQVIDKSTNRTIVNQYAGNTTAFTPNVNLVNGRNYEFKIKGTNQWPMGRGTKGSL